MSYLLGNDQLLYAVLRVKMFKRKHMRMDSTTYAREKKKAHVRTDFRAIRVIL